MSNKKQVREDFRNACFERDGWKCVMCGRSDCPLDAHHIMDRHDMPNGGYVPENGITLCNVEGGCHWKAEHWHATGTAYPGYGPDDLFNKIGSDLDKALEASEKLGVAGNIIAALESGVRWAKGEIPLRTTTFRQTPDGLVREVAEKYVDELDS